MVTKTRLIRTVLLAAGALFVAPSLLSQTDLPADEVTRESLKFSKVYGVLEQNYMDRVDPDRGILDGGVRGTLSVLDPFSAFFDRDQFTLLQEQASGKSLGFGSILYVQIGKVMILQTAEGSPSWRAGLGPGDEIVEVNGTRIDRLDFNSLIDLLQRSRSQPARLGVIRPGRVVAQEFELSPAEVPVPTVDKAFEFAPEIGYIHLSGFEQKTPQEVIDALLRLGGSRLKGLLLDLRDNHGGMIDAALEVASLFLKPDLLVLTVRGRALPEKSYRTYSGPRHFDVPVVVLVNGNTASAAEVFAASLQEHDRALLVGEPTFGKGVVETVMGLSERTGLALTTGQYFTPSGRSIQRPLPGTALAVTGTIREGQGHPSEMNFRTDNGRSLSAGAGLTPDVNIPAPGLDPWVTFLNQRGLFTSFASDYLTLHGKVNASFDPDSRVLDDFRHFLTRQRVRVPAEYWAQDQVYIKLRIKAEAFNLVFGLAFGDEVEVRGDPQVQQAATLFSRVPLLLKASPAEPGTLHVKRVAQ